MGLAFLVWVGGGLLKRVLYFFGNEPSLGQKCPTLHLPLIGGTRTWVFADSMAIAASATNHCAT